jgi:hypothetical protein
MHRDKVTSAILGEKMAKEILVGRLLLVLHWTPISFRRK